ncbi:putative bifunctional diguanylate cyclase/phosphodiesterase [Arhodomonas sp. SL1]|uniref:putative bifunctional diguanylate cyclase/phosphodiesterase n=1 Tax=Arhodomonas sp. SL1 TaxID=3425691 RepID=UPI003F881E50
MLTAAVALLGVLLAGLTGYTAYTHERSSVDTAFRTAGQEHAAALVDTWQDELASVEQIADLFRVGSVVTRSEFSRLARSLLARHDAVRALEWVPRVTDLSREVFVARVQGEIPGFVIADHGPDGELVAAPRRPVYFPILYVEPLEENRAALGYAPSEHPTRNDAITRAIERGSLTVSATTRLIQEDNARPAVLGFVPVSSAEGYVHARGVRGLAEGVFHVDRLAGNAFAALQSRGLEIALSDVTDDPNAAPLHTVTGAHDSRAWYQWPGEQMLERRWGIGGRNYVTRIQAVGARFAYDLRLPALATGLALGLAVLATWLVHTLLARERAVHTLAQRRADQLAHLSRHDPLTGLLNRVGFQRELEDAVERIREAGSGTACVCLIDLDQFKLVNNVSGHQAGDALIRALVPRLRALCRPDDRLARIGGDEFGLLLPSLDAAAASALTRRYLDAVALTPFQWGQRQFPVTASAGIVELNVRTASTTNAMSKADAACYIAKEHGRNRLHVFLEDDQLSERFRDEMSWVSGIREAMGEGRLCLHAQAIQPMRGRSPGPPIRRMELLLRLRERDGTLTAPGTFLPAAERYGLMPEIDRWVLGRLARRIQSRPPPEGTVWFVNLSGQTLGDAAFYDFVLDILEHGAIPPESLCFEITETAVISNHSAAQAFIERLRRIGCRFALDDFGSGMASFGYLKELPVDYLKIDGTFVRGMPHSTLDRAICAAIQRLAGELGIATVAEAVEDAAVLEAVRGLEVDYAQGYLFGRPMPLEDYLDGRPAQQLTVIDGFRG